MSSFLVPGSLLSLSVPGCLTSLGMNQVQIGSGSVLYPFLTPQGMQLTQILL